MRGEVLLGRTLYCENGLHEQVHASSSLSVKTFFESFPSRWCIRTLCDEREQAGVDVDNDKPFCTVGSELPSGKIIDGGSI